MLLSITTILLTLLPASLSLSVREPEPKLKPPPPPPPPKHGKIIFDGRIPQHYTVADFDKTTSIYDHTYIHGENQTFAEILKLPHVPPSLFDIPTNTKAVEVTLNNQSIFLAGTQLQYGFRRSELIPGTNNGTDATTVGVITYHWSIRTDPTRPLNYTHEYHPAWHETNDYSSSQFTFQTGKYFSQSNEIHGPTNPYTLRFAGRQTSPETVFFSTPFTKDVWHNFAITLSYTANTLAIYYSEGYDKLKQVVKPTTNDNTGQGQFHIGMFKLPAPPSDNVALEGYQDPHANEGLIYGGIFIEDSSNGGVALSP